VHCFAYILLEHSMPPEDGAGPSGSVPVIFAFCGAGIAAMGFGAGYGASAYRRSNAFKELLEKFPEPPSAEAEQLARSGAGRAFLYGTGLAGLMGVGAVMAARANGIRSAQDLADAIKSWLPSREGLEGYMVPKLAPLQRTVTEHLQVARQGAGEQFKKTELGRTLSRRASLSADIARQPGDPSEKEIMEMIDRIDKPPPKK